MAITRAQRKPAKKTATTSVVELGADWLNHHRAAGRLPSTMRGYMWSIDHVLIPWCEREEIRDVTELDQRALDKLGREMLDGTRPDGSPGPPRGKQTVVAYIRPIRQFLEWARDEVGLDVQGRPVLPVRRRPKPRDVLTREEIQRMEDAALLERDKLMIRILGDTGMRISELIGLRPDDLQERNRQWFLYVRGKGENDRLVPIPRLAKRLQRWIERGRRQPCADAVFPVARQTGGYYRQLGYHTAYRVVCDAAEAAGITKHVHPHALRHAFITHLKRKMIPDAQISLIVGNFTALDYYTHMGPADAYSLMVSLD